MIFHLKRTHLLDISCSPLLETHPDLGEQQRCESGLSNDGIFGWFSPRRRPKPSLRWNQGWRQSPRFLDQRAMQRQRRLHLWLLTQNPRPGQQLLSRKRFGCFLYRAVSIGKITSYVHFNTKTDFFPVLLLSVFQSKSAWRLVLWPIAIRDLRFSCLIYMHVIVWFIQLIFFWITRWHN